MKISSFTVAPLDLTSHTNQVVTDMPESGDIRGPITALTCRQYICKNIYTEYLRLRLSHWAVACDFHAHCESIGHTPWSWGCRGESRRQDDGMTCFQCWPEHLAWSTCCRERHNKKEHPKTEKLTRTDRRSQYQASPDTQNLNKIYGIGTWHIENSNRLIQLTDSNSGKKVKPDRQINKFMHTCLQLHAWSDNTDAHSHAWTL